MNGPLHTLMSCFYTCRYTSLSTVSVFSQGFSIVLENWFFFFFFFFEGVGCLSMYPGNSELVSAKAPLERLMRYQRLQKYLLSK